MIRSFVNPEAVSTRVPLVSFCSRLTLRHKKTKQKRLGRIHTGDGAETRGGGGGGGGGRDRGER